MKKVKKVLMLCRGEVWRQVNMIAKFLDLTKSFVTETAICIVRALVLSECNYAQESHVTNNNFFDFSHICRTMVC